jgi:integrase
MKKLGRPIGTGTNGRARYLTVDELAAFFATAKKAGKKWDLLFGLTFYFGMRVGEVVALRITDVNMAAHQLTIRAEKGGHTRTYDLPERIEKKIRAWLKERPEGNPFLFPSRTCPRTEPLSRVGAQKMFYELSRKAGIGAHSVHDLRHTAASMMAQAGDNVVQIARWLRQKQVASAERYLSDIDREKHERDMEQRAAKFL